MGAGLAGVCVVAWLAALSVYDIRERRLPNWLTMPGAAVIIATASMSGRGAPAVLGAVALFAVYAAVYVVSPAAMGAGDVKLAIGIGALTGIFGGDVWLLAALGAPLLTAGWAIVTVLRRSGEGGPHARLYRIVVGRHRMRVPAPAARMRRTRPCPAGFRRDAPAGRELHLVHASSAAAGRVGVGTYVNTGYGQAVLRPESWIGLAGGSPVPVGTGASGSRPRSVEEIRRAKRGVESLFGGSKCAGRSVKRTLQPRQTHNGRAESLMSRRRPCPASPGPGSARRVSSGYGRRHVHTVWF